ncbi:MAG: CHASE2 domain-containing protein, partial [Candidatus Omnitrophota bacterium]
MAKDKKWASKALIVLAALVVLAPSWLRTFDTFELATLDLRYRLRPAQPQNKDIAIIEIAEDTLEKVGRWPFTRNWHADIISILSKSGAKSIIFDVLFAEPSEHDAILAESTRMAGNVYYACAFDRLETGKSGAIKAGGIDAFPLKVLRDAARGTGFINLIPDKDGKTRRAPLNIRYEDKIYRHIALLAAAGYMGKSPDDIDIPVDGSGMALINFAGK